MGFFGNLHYGLNELVRGTGLAPGGLTGSTEMYGASDDEIARQLAGSREFNQRASQQMYDRGMRGMASSASARGFGTSGAIPMGAANVGEGVDMMRLMAERQAIEQANAMRNSRTYVQQPGLLQILMGGLLPGLGQAGGAYIAGQAGTSGVPGKPNYS
jgi:hypothetical protein